MRIEAILFQIYLINIHGEIIENNFPFSPEFGRPKASIFCSMGVRGRLDALLAKSLNPRIYWFYQFARKFIFHMVKPISSS